MKIVTADLIVSVLEVKGYLNTVIRNGWSGWQRLLRVKSTMKPDRTTVGAYTNVKAVYDNIKLDFYHNLNN